MVGGLPRRSGRPLPGLAGPVKRRPKPALPRFGRYWPQPFADGARLRHTSFGRLPEGSLIGHATIQNADGCRDRPERITRAVARFGGRVAVRGGRTAVCEDEPLHRHANHAFSGCAAADRFYRSDFYCSEFNRSDGDQRLAALRLANADSVFILVEGHE